MSLCAALAFCALLANLSPSASRAETAAEFYARTNVRMIIAADPGGSYDTTARLLARHLGKHLPGGLRIIPETMVGASGRVAANYMYNVAPRDGSVIALVQQSVPQSQAIGENNVQYDAARFNWIGSPIRLDDVLVVWHGTGVHSIEDAKKKQVVIGATTATGTNYIYPKLLNELVGTKFKIVTGYQGAAAIVLALERGEVEGHGSNPWGDWKAVRPAWIAEKKIIPLMQMSLEPAPDLPDVPLLISLAPNEQARAVFELMSVTADMQRPFLAPPGVPADRVAALRTAFRETIADPDYVADAEKGHKEAHLVSGEQLDALAKRVLGAPKSAIDLLRTSLAR